MAEISDLVLSNGYVAIRIEKNSLVDSSGIVTVKAGDSDVGPIDYTYNGCERFSVGDRVLIPPFRSVALKYNGNSYAIIHEKEILVKFSKSEK